ncbi:MAG TPA: hypothetical protein VND93_17035 [Myxococcales bacterium]|nr:hypothetical protein [Myxococcales bacterium]
MRAIASALAAVVLLFSAAARAQEPALDAPWNAHLLPAPAPASPAHETNVALRLVGEIGAGFLGEAVLFFPAAFGGYFIGSSLATTANCSRFTLPTQRGECEEFARSDGGSLGAIIGMTLGDGLGSGLGAAIASGWLQPGNVIWPSVALSFAGAIGGLLIPGPYFFLTAGAGALAGAVIGCELGRAFIKTPPPAPPGPSVVPTLQISSDGGFLGLAGRF